MTAAWLPGLVLALGGLAAEPPRIEVRVTTSAGPGGGAGGGAVDDAGLGGALAQALVDAGLPATRVRDPAATCHDRCLRVQVHRTDARQFLIEVRASGEPARVRVELDGSASPFDLAHALAIQVEALAARAPPRRRRAPRPMLAEVAAAPAPDAEDAPGAPTPAAPASPPPTIAEDDGTPAYAPSEDAPNVHAAAPPPTPPPLAAETRLALNVAAVVLTAPGGDLFMPGLTVGARVRVTPRTDLRAGIAFLRPQRRSLLGTSHQREILPLQVAIATELPRLPSVRAGVGVEAMLISGEVAGREQPSSWALGAVGRLEYRYAIRSFALLAAAQAALHPPRWRTEHLDPRPLDELPHWTLVAALGLEFTVF